MTKLKYWYYCITCPYFEYSISRQLNMIEKGILPLTDALYTCSVFIVASCEGHPVTKCKKWFRNIVEIHPVRPYVYFICDEDIGIKIQFKFKQVRERLNYSWKMSNNYKNKWTIEVSENHGNTSVIDKVSLSNDITILASALKKIK